ncbi:hypothetical protein SDRG_14476 [Saprolegnia diclina VS20]|uniref:F-box domain-containing protein n=1 Tax=Saprolegnia diclina (strain VS20) TaxID=1156394 RepID=T0Q2U3_SAPDV|nr:hypothetical protein SDRG_14476 [Saprolegnia diclina VS20]EQC27725.1 hypothetical protein SDRG_14476 [Saprolegnia diclina VS20]|eukprot:XP_008618830.1 hypothetical protein SDRG_14476 [Saprolegnia diclina VS20]
MACQRARGYDVGVLAPEIAEAIALFIPCAASFERFTKALPASATTSALASLARLFSEPALSIAWPNVEVRSPSLSRAAAKDLAAITALAPKRVVVSYKIENRKDLGIVAGIAPWITELTFYLGDESLFSVIDAATWAYYRTTLASCQRLETFVLSDCSAGYGALDGVFFDLPCLTSLTIGAYNGFDGNLQCHVKPAFTAQLTKWLQTQPVTTLGLDFVWFGLDPDTPKVLALCDAISNCTTLTALRLNNVDVFAEFLNGRPLPERLKRLEWDVDDYDGTDDSQDGWDNFVAALVHGPQLQHLGCKHLDALMEEDDVLEKVEGLTSLEAHYVGRDVVGTLDVLQLLSNMPNLKHLQLKHSSFANETARMLFATVCTRSRLETFGLGSHQLEANDARQLFQVMPHVPNWPLKHLDLSEHDFDVDDIVAMLPTMNAAIKNLQVVQLQGEWGKKELAQFAAAVRALPDRHFVIVPRWPHAAFRAQWSDIMPVSDTSPLCMVFV